MVVGMVVDDDAAAGDGGDNDDDTYNGMTGLMAVMTHAVHHNGDGDNDMDGVDGE